MNDILFGNNNSKVITKLSKRYFKKNKVRNLAALLAIILTAFLFTSITSLAFNMASSIQLSLQMQKGSKADGTLGYMTEEQYEQLVNSDFVEQAGHRRIIGYASNTSSHSIEINYADSVQQELTFCVPTHGAAPEKANEIATTDLALKALGVEPEIGAEVPLEFELRGKTYHYDMVLSGWWEASNDSVSVATVSEQFIKENPDVVQNTYAVDHEMSGVTFSDVVLKNKANVQQQLNEFVYADAYKAAVEIVGGEQYILSAVMHADERNRAMSEALGEDVYHYHLHVVYIPVVEKQILWSKRCKDEALRGTVKEVITQVSRSKKWESKPVLDEDGNPMLNARGKKILRSSYSVLQDDFFHFMRVAGYTDLERGERGSTEEHLTVTQFKVQAEQQRLETVAGQVAQVERGLENAKAATEKQKQKLEALQKETKTAKTVALTVQEIETMGKKATFGNNVVLTPDECDTLKHYAVNGIIANADNKRLKEKLASAEKTVSIWKQRYEAVSEKYMELKQKAQPFLDALEIASEKVRAFINSILIRGKETQEHEHPARKRGQDMEL